MFKFRKYDTKNIFYLNVFVGNNKVVLQPSVIVNKATPVMVIEYDAMPLHNFNKQTIKNTIRRIRKGANFTPIEEADYDYKKVYDNIAKEFEAKDWIDLAKGEQKVLVGYLTRKANGNYFYALGKPSYEKRTRSIEFISHHELPSGASDDQAIDKLMELLKNNTAIH